jgi:hypothetical protein
MAASLADVVASSGVVASLDVVVLKVEMSDHSGDCSGKQCIYVTYDVPMRVESMEDVKKAKHHLEARIDAGMNIYGSFCCGNHPESERHDLGKHDFRVTIVSKPMHNPASDA